MIKKQIEGEIGKVKELIELVKEKRKEDIKESYFKEAIHDTGHMKYRYVCRKKFLSFLEEQEIDNDLIKKLKTFKIKEPQKRMIRNIINYSRNEWKEFLEILSILKEYYPKYKLYNAKKDLCYYTDCYKKLATARYCERCMSENPLDAIYCNHCGAML